MQAIAQGCARFVIANYAEAFDTRSERREIGGHVAGATESFALLDEIHYRDGGFRRKTRCGTPQIAVQHQVAENSDAFSAKAGNQTFETASITFRSAGHRKKISRRDRPALFSSYRSFFQQHDGNFVSNRINTSTGAALDPTAI